MLYRMLTPISLLLLSALFFMLPACGGGPRASTSTTQQINSTTKGQELLDLRKAYDQGIISEKDYNRQKERILERK